jgi:hypothetical protein
MTAKTIHAIRIYCTASMTPDAALGIYAPYAAPTGSLIATEIRLSEDVLSGLASEYAYTAGLIAQKGIGGLSQSADLRRGGDMAAYEGMQVSLVNAEQLFLQLKAGGVNLQGCRIELHEFTGTAANSASAADTVLFTGICDDLSWTSTGLTLKCKSSRLRRNAPLYTVIDNGDYADVQQALQDLQNNVAKGNYPFALDDDNGKIVPITFGSLPKAKMVRTADAVIPFIINGSTAITISGTAYYVTNFSLPTDATQYRYRVAASAILTGDAQAFPVVSVADRGDWSASSGNFPPNGATQNGSGIEGQVHIGDFWTASSAGTVGSIAYAVGDIITALIDNPGTTTANWVRTAGNAGYITGINNPLGYRIKFANPSSAGVWEKSTDTGVTWVTLTSTLSSCPLTAIQGCYINVLGGTNAGEYRLIASATPYLNTALTSETNSPDYLAATDNAQIAVILYSVFEKPMAQGALGATTHAQSGEDPNQPWVEIDNIYRQYTADVWPLAGFN